MPGMCQLCSTVCGIVGHVKDGRADQGRGQPEGPQLARQAVRSRSGGAQPSVPPRTAALSASTRRSARFRQVGGGSAGTRPTTRMAEKLERVPRDPTRPQFAFHQGRSRSKDPVSAFLNAFGTKTHLNHRGLCSAARRAANLTYLFESDWDLGRLRELEVHPELRLEHVRGAPGARRRRAAHPAWPLRERREAGDLRRAHVEHGRQLGRVLHAASGNRRRRSRSPWRT